MADDAAVGELSEALRGNTALRTLKLGVDLMAKYVEGVQPPAGTTMESVDDVIVPVFRGDIVADGIKWPDGNKWQRR